MKTNAEYKKDERERKRKSGLKRLSDVWIFPCDESKIKEYIVTVTEETRNIKKRLTD
jgi:hypothetical protein